MSLDRKILERIESDNIRIRPKIFFNVRDIFWKIGMAVFLIAGSIVFGLVFAIGKRYGWGMIESISFYVWTAMFGLIIFLAKHILSKIDGLYRAGQLTAVFFLCLFSSLAGLAAFSNDYIQTVEGGMGKIKAYREMVETDNANILKSEEFIDKIKIDNNETVEILEASAEEKKIDARIDNNNRSESENINEERSFDEELSELKMIEYHKEEGDYFPANTQKDYSAKTKSSSDVPETGSEEKEELHEEDEKQEESDDDFDDSENDDDTEDEADMEGDTEEDED